MGVFLTCSRVFSPEVTGERNTPFKARLSMRRVLGGFASGLARGASGGKSQNLAGVLGAAIGRGVANAARRRRTRRSAPRSYPRQRAPPRRRPRAARGGSRSAVYAVPSRVGSQQRAAVQNTISMVRTEVNEPLIDTKSLCMYRFSLVAGDEETYPCLSQAASQYQRFRFAKLIATWNPSCGTEAKGEIAVGAVASAKDALDVKSWDDIVGLPGAKFGPIWMRQNYVFGPQCFSEQYSRGWTVVTPAVNVDPLDPTQSQGELVVGVRGCSTTATTTMGNFAMTYNCQLMKPKVKENTVALMAAQIGTSNHADFEDDDLMHFANPWIKLESGSTPLEYVITWRSRQPFHLLFACTGVATEEIQMPGTESVEVRSIQPGTHASETALTSWFHVKPDEFTRRGTLTLTVVAQSVTSYSFVAVRGSKYIEFPVEMMGEPILP